MPVVVVTSADGDPAVVVPVVVVLEVVMVHSAATVQFRIEHCVAASRWRHHAWHCVLRVFSECLHKSRLLLINYYERAPARPRRFKFHF